MYKLTVLPVLLLAACGIPGDTLLLDLTADDADLICKHAVDEDAETRTVDCSGTEVPVEPATMQECLDYFAAVLTVNNPDCTADLDTWVACKEEPEYTDEQVCDPTLITVSDDCMAVVTCVTPATPTTAM
jgi:hypothetical protein